MSPKVGELINREEFISRILAYNPKANIELIKKAYDFSEKAHEGIKRLSGEPYFIHPQEVAKILIEQHLDTPTICAALLHDILEDTSYKPQQIKDQFGEEILLLVQGVTKIKDISLEDLEAQKAEDLRKILLATTKDVRVILIKLADRLHNMRTLKYQPKDKQSLISRETLEIYAPIAHKLGMNRVKSELEDLCLFYMEPETYQYFKARINKKKEVRDAEVKTLIEQLMLELKNLGINAKIFGRAKNFYSIYQKMKKRNLTFDEIYDLVALRIIVEKMEDCYKALGVVHRLWKPLPTKFKDYISVPKSNGYQSLHTVVIGERKRIEVQIRTWEMHYAAEEGIAAHWLYKGDEKDKEFDKKVAWLKQILEWLRESTDAKNFIDTLKIDLFKDEIIVFTPKGKPIPLPEKSTPVDFAYAIHTDIGDKCSKAKVNNHIVPLDYVLKSGDIIEIITAKNAVPSHNMLKWARTSLARSKIRQALGIQLEGKAPPKEEEKKEERKIETVSGLKKNILKFSKCCNPAFGSDIRAFKTQDGKITIHLRKCINVHTMDPAREVQLKWEEEKKDPLYRITAHVRDRVGMLSDVLNVFTQKDLNLSSVRTTASKDHVKLFFALRSPYEREVQDVVDEIRKVKDVMEIRFEKEK